MIQATTTKHIEPKAPQGVVGKGKAAEALKGDVGAVAGENEFASALEASLSPEVQVKPIQVTEEQLLEMPTDLINFNPAGSGETTTPKVFDPSLTQDVEKLIRPTTTEAPAQLIDTEMLKLAQGEMPEQVVEGQKAEFAQALLKTPQTNQTAQGGRSPAIEFAQSEVDPQLMNLDDFVTQKNLVSKKNTQANAYGMPSVQAQKIALENGLNTTQVVKEATSAEGQGSSSVNSQQFILNLMNEQKAAPQSLDVQAAPKVFDMSQVKTSNSEQILNQVTDYIVQAKAAKEPTVNMRVNHQELGMIDITVSRAVGNQEAVAINIGAHSMDGKNFFQQNSKDLFAHLTQAGVSVSDFKVETPSQSGKQDFDFNQQSGKQSGSEKQFASEQNQRRHEQERRQELWKLFNKEAA